MKEMEALRAHMATLTPEQRRAMKPEEFEELKKRFNVPPPPFEVGDVVRFKSGGACFTVLEQIALDRVSLISSVGPTVVTCEAPVMVLEKVEKNN